MANQDENGQTFCPKCKGRNWSCWDESTECEALARIYEKLAEDIRSAKS